MVVLVPSPEEQEEELSAEESIERFRQSAGRFF
jgi:hypothetical protein